MSARSRFVLLFSVLLSASFSLVSLEVVNRSFVEPFTSRVALAGALTLRLVGERVDVHGTVIRGQDFAVNVRNGCNGLEAVAIFVAAVLAHPRRNLVTAAAGAVAIQLVNVLRVAGLFWIGRHAPSLFDLTHTVIAQTAVILFAFSLFLAFAVQPQKARA